MFIRQCIVLLLLRLGRTRSSRLTDPRVPSSEGVVSPRDSRSLLVRFRDAALSVDLPENIASNGKEGKSSDDVYAEPSLSEKEPTRGEYSGLLEHEHRHGLDGSLSAQDLSDSLGAPKSSGEETMPCGMIHNVSLPDVAQLKQELSRYVQPNESGHFGGSATWAHRFHARVEGVGLIWDERVRRRSLGPENVEIGWKSECEHFPLAAASIQGGVKFPVTLDKLGSLAQHSVVARRLYAARILGMQGLQEFMARNVVESVQYLAAALRLDDSPVIWPGPHLEAAIQTFYTLLEKSKDKGIRADACLVLGSFYFLGLRLHERALGILRRGQQIAPEDETLVYLEGVILNRQDHSVASVAALERSIKLGNCNNDILFLLGQVLQGLSCQSQSLGLRQRSRDYFHRYILRAPPEDRYVAEAHFSLAVLEGTMSYLGTARRHYEEGLRALSERLQGFEDQPTEPSFMQCLAAVKLDKLHACGNEECARLGSLLCSGCRSIRYCSEACQKGHWKEHKNDCQDVQRPKKKKDTAPSN